MLEKMNKNWTRRFLLALLTLACHSAYAEPWYQVEVIVFSQQDMFGDEKPRPNIQLSYPKGNWTVLKPSSSQDPAYAVLDQNQRKLGPDSYTLRRAPGYRVLFHAAWRQPGLNMRKSPWILIRGGERQSDGHYELEGSLRLVKTRFLHLQADLWKTRFLKPGQSSNVSWPALPVRPTASAQAETEEVTDSLITASNIRDIVTLKGAEKLKLGEIAYLDHPNMGVLVRVDRYQAQAEPVASTTPEG